MLNVMSAARYENVRALCHALRNKDDGAAIKNAAELLYPLLPHTVWIIPVPSHNGTAEVTLRLAQMLQIEAMLRHDKIVGIIPGLAGKARESLYEYKKAGKDISLVELGLYATQNLKELTSLARRQSIPVILLDIVVDTGTTAMAAAHATGISDILCVGTTGNHQDL